MTTQRIAITETYQSIPIPNIYLFFTDKLANVEFGTGATSPDITGVSQLLLAGIENKIFLSNGSTLWVKSQNGNSTIILDDEIIA